MRRLNTFCSVASCWVMLTLPFNVVNRHDRERGDYRGQFIAETDKHVMPTDFSSKTWFQKNYFELRAVSCATFFELLSRFETGGSNNSELRTGAGECSS